VQIGNYKTNKHRNNAPEATALPHQHPEAIQ